MDVSRRRAMTAVGVAVTAGLAGCGDPGSRRTSTPLFVTNESDMELRVTLRIYELPESSDGENGTETTNTPATSELQQVVVERTTLSAEGGAFSLEAGAVPNAPLRVRIATDDGPTDSYDWYRPDAQSTLDVRIRQRSIRFTELA
ncbi:hypothetical protein KY092_19050 [Natronomonas gomsonensis]|jgi:hypothetical protein|uniref:hypothetical protein n=1 Tax=Natronomonas gomsonensis TaxID=1046043 RepID=UPI0020CA2BAD|nr:hypothetical protein [Natronomonas gomsonensis]MCY4732641.1 hypothetical protein [Natronomonas gomsonensis]